MHHVVNPVKWNREHDWRAGLSQPCLLFNILPSGRFAKKARPGFHGYLIAGLLQRDGFRWAIHRANTAPDAEIPLDHYPLTGFVFTQTYNLQGTHIHAGFTQRAFIVVYHRFKIGFSSSALVS